MTNDLTLTEQPDGKYQYVQLTFAEDVYCEKRALGKKKREAYRLAFPDRASDSDKTIDMSAMRLEARPEIKSRIAEWILDQTEDEKIRFRADRQWAIDECRRQLRILTHDPKLFATGGIKLLEFLGKLEGWFTDRLEITASTAPGAGQLDSSEVESKIDSLLLMMSRNAQQKEQDK